MRVAVAGGGIFGCTSAFMLARAGHDVHLYETKRQLMQCASGSSFYRLHQGYHYPRSPSTGRECRDAEASFRGEYGDCLIEDGHQIYAIANGSITSGDVFMAFMDHEGLPYLRLNGAEKSCSHVFEVTEPLIDETRMAEMAISRLWASGVKVHTGATLPEDSRDRFDKIVVCAYAGINSVLNSLGLDGEDYKFQVVEKPIITMEKKFSDVSIVVLDGPFCCIDPHGTTGHHVLGHVTQANHHENVGLYPEVPSELAPFINSGMHKNCPHSRKDRIIAAAKEYIPGVERAEYVGSMFTVRAHLAGVEDTDKRPTLVRQHDSQVLSVFSGKIGTAVQAGQKILTILKEGPARSCVTRLNDLREVQPHIAALFKPEDRNNV